MFFVGDYLLPADAPIEHFQHIIQIVLTLDNQKNSIPGETVYHFRSESHAACPVQEGINIFLLLQEYGYEPATPVKNYSTAQVLRLVSALNTIDVIRAKTQRVGAARLVFSPEDVGKHSLRSGRAMDMHIMGVPDRNLMSIGWWRLLGFMVYIQQQISSFRTGISVHMSKQT